MADALKDPRGFERIALIGIGLIGSSIAHAARRGGLVGTIVGQCADRETRATALRLGHRR